VLYTVPAKALGVVAGADVTHPTSRKNNEPSIAAVCCSTNVYWTRYAADIQLLPPRVEIISVCPCVSFSLLAAEL
jgi:hypothetical protein